VDGLKDLVVFGVSWLVVAVVGLVVLTGWWCLRWRGQEVHWLPLPRRRRISWHGFDIVMIFALVVLLPSVVRETLHQIGIFDWLYGESEGSATRGRQLLWSSVVAVPLVIAFLLLGLHCVRSTRPVELGLTWRRAWSSITLGYLVWAVLTPAAVLLQAGLNEVTPKEFIEPHWLTQTGLQTLDVDEWILMWVGPVLLAPLLEELVFRGLLLPWQLRNGWEAQATVAFCALVIAALGGSHAEGGDYNPFPLLFVVALLPGLFLLPYWRHRRGPAWAAQNNLDVLASSAPSAAVTRQLPAPTDSVRTLQPSAAWQDRLERRLGDILLNAGAARAQPGLAIYTNSLLFAAMHSVAWPSPLPLFFLSLGLAWLKVRANSLLGCLTLHALFNAVSVLSLMLELNAG
jgi:membrane protease YdiL (CAAX protease family)